jgi:DnaJ-class molecular chaperone
MKCDKCNGEGFGDWEIKDNYKVRIACRKCFGSGEIDWLENIIGKEPPGNLKIEMLVQPIKSLEKIEFIFEVK